MVFEIVPLGQEKNNNKHGQGTKMNAKSLKKITKNRNAEPEDTRVRNQTKKIARGGNKQTKNTSEDKHE